MSRESLRGPRVGRAAAAAGEAGRTDPRLVRAHELDDRAFAMMEELSRDTRAAQSDPTLASDPERLAAFKRDRDARLAEIQRLNEESAALSEAADRTDAPRTAGMRAARRSTVPLLLGVLALLLLTWGRARGFWG